MNMLQSSDRRMKAIKENSIRSFNAAAEFSVDFVEFDVQVRFTVPVISLLLCGAIFIFFPAGDFSGHGEHLPIH